MDINVRTLRRERFYSLAYILEYVGPPLLRIQEIHVLIGNLLVLELIVL